MAHHSLSRPARRCPGWSHQNGGLSTDAGTNVAPAQLTDITGLHVPSRGRLSVIFHPGTHDRLVTDWADRLPPPERNSKEHFPRTFLDMDKLRLGDARNPLGQSTLVCTYLQLVLEVLALELPGGNGTGTSPASAGDNTACVLASGPWIWKGFLRREPIG